MRYGLAIFDFDGTLADTCDWFVGTINGIPGQYGFRDLEAARQEGIDFGAVTWGYTTGEAPRSATRAREARCTSRFSASSTDSTRRTGSRRRVGSGSGSRANAAPDLDPEAVLNRPLWEFVAGEEVRELLRLVAGAWVEVEEAVGAMDLFSSSDLPALSHGICRPCAERAFETVAEPDGG